MADSRTLELILRLKDEASSELSAFQKRLEPAADASKKVALALGAAGAAAGAFGYSAIKAAADIETQRLGFKTLLGSVEAADAAIRMIQRDAASTPFEFAGLVEANKALTFVTKNAEQSEKVLLNVGKALSAAGKGQAELNNIIYNLQQIGNTGKITEMDIRQFGYNGINILELLANYYGTTKEAAADMVKNSKDAFGDLSKAFEQAGSEGGMYANAFKDQAGSFNQLASNLRDSWNQFLAGEGQKLIEWAKQFIILLTDIIQNHLPGWIDKTAQLVDWLSQHKEVLLIVAGAIVGALTPAILSATAAFLAAAVALAPFILGGAIVGGLVAGILLIVKHWDLIEARTIEVWQRIKDYLYQTYDGVRLLIREKWDAIAKYFADLWEGIKNTFSSAVDWIMNKLSPLLNALDRVKGGISSIGSFIGSGVSAVGKAIGVNDAIISPNGNIITTHPDDYLIATKTPGALGSGGVVVNVYGDVSGQELVAKVSEGIMNTLRLNSRLPV